MVLTVLAVIVTVIHDRRKKYHSYLGKAFVGGIVILIAAAAAEIVRMWSSVNNGRGAIASVGLFFFLASLTYTAIRALGLQMKRQQDAVIRSKEETEEMGIQLVTTLVNAVDAKDPYTNGHSNRVALYSREIARMDGKSEEYQDRIFYMGIVHDIGKIGIPDSILQKPGRLTDEEFGVIKTHPNQGADILSDTTEMPWIVKGARWHHERYDGKGYPDGLAGDEIPEEARIIAVADAYDAMTSDRSYRSGMDQKKVRTIIEEGKGTQWDPHFADIMIEMIDRDKNYKMRGSTGSDILGVISLSLLLDSGFSEKGPLSTYDDGFKQIYQFLKKYARRNKKDVQLVLLTLHNKDKNRGNEFLDASGQLAEVIKGSIRQSDILSQLNEIQFMIILTDATVDNADIAINRIMDRFASISGGEYKLTYEVRDIVNQEPK
ncbi:MAG: HD domain-containing protein [Eubacterium sp.]|nr:HD domain-containing protein [Eubacterium sp.]